MKKNVHPKDIADILVVKVFRNKNKTIADRLVTRIIEDGIYSEAQAKRLLISQENLYHADDSILCRVLLSLEAIVRETNPEDNLYRDMIAIGIHTRDYFTEEEVGEYSKGIGIISREIDLRTIHNCRKLAHGQYCGLASVSQIARMHIEGILTVDPNLQRDVERHRIKVRTENGGTPDEIVISNVYVNPERVREIADKIKKGKYYYNAIRFNCMGVEAPEIDDEGTMVIPEEADVYVIDGNHRTMAAETAYVECPEMENVFDSTYFVVLVTFYQKNLARECISQEWNVERVSKRRKTTMAVNYSNRIVNWIKEDDEADPAYRDRMYSDITVKRSMNGCVDEAILSESIQTVFETDSITTDADARKIKRQIVRTFNCIADVFSEDLRDPNESQKTKWNIHPVAWGGYVYLAKFSAGVQNRESVLRKTLLGIDFDRTEETNKKNRYRNAYIRIGKMLVEEAKKYVG